MKIFDKCVICYDWYPNLLSSNASSWDNFTTSKALKFVALIFTKGALLALKASNHLAEQSAQRSPGFKPGKWGR